MIRQGIFAVICFLAAICSAAVGDSHRILVLDAGAHRGADNHRLLLVEVESGKGLANVELGTATNVGVSGDGKTVAALTFRSGSAGSETRLSFYRTDDLSLMDTGTLAESSVLPGRLMAGYGANIHFAPDGKEIVYCGLAPREPGRVANVDFATTVITRVKREVDDRGAYRSLAAATVEPCRAVDFVSLTKWPKVVVLNQTTSELLTIDLDGGDIVHRLTVTEPASVSFMPMRLRGICLADGGGNAYFLPRKPGLLKKIDLTGDPQVTIARGAGEANVRGYVAAASEHAGRVFLLDDRRNPAGLHQPARTLKVFSTADLSFQQEIEVPLADCHWLAVSRDGKYLYATGPLNGPPFEELSITRSCAAVIDASSGCEVKILEAGQRPALVFPVADQ
jgi:hypothetical protein